jgi:hypothetical protein
MWKQTLRSKARVPRSSPVMAVALLALFIAMGGSALAAGHYLITSTKQINPKVLKQLRGNTGPHGLEGSKGLAGAQGPQGGTGPAGTNGTNGTDGTNGVDGTNGASAGLADFNNGPIDLKAKAEEQTVATLPNVPAGSYILIGKVMLENTNSGAGVEMRCFLRAGGDFDESAALLDEDDGPGSYVQTLPFTVSHTFASPGTVTLGCEDSGAPDVVVYNAKISAVQVQTLARTSG